MYYVSPSLSFANQYTPTPTTYNATWSSYGVSGYPIPPSAIRIDYASPSLYEAPHSAVYTSLSIPSTGNVSVGYSSGANSATTTPRRAEAPPGRALSWVSPSGTSNSVTIPTASSRGTSIAPSSGSVSVPTPPASPPAATHPDVLPASGPEYVAELGRAAWKVLHAVAEQYPMFPSYDEQQSAFQFIYNFAKLYPCMKCRLHFQQILRTFPPDVSSQPAFKAWMSDFHDRVNADLRKAPSA